MPPVTVSWLVSSLTGNKGFLFDLSSRYCCC